MPLSLQAFFWKLVRAGLLLHSSWLVRACISQHIVQAAIPGSLRDIHTPIALNDRQVLGVDSPSQS